MSPDETEQGTAAVVGREGGVRSARARDARNDWIDEQLASQRARRRSCRSMRTEVRDAVMSHVGHGDVAHAQRRFDAQQRLMAAARKHATRATTGTTSRLFHAELDDVATIVLVDAHAESRPTWDTAMSPTLSAGLMRSRG
jgi:hypothetical protein